MRHFMKPRGAITCRFYGLLNTMNYVLILAGPIVVALAAFTTYASMVRSLDELWCSFKLVPSSNPYSIYVRLVYAAPLGDGQNALTGVDLVT